MNRSLLTSIHGVVIVAITAGLTAIPFVQGFDIGRGSGSSRDYLIWSGWAALALFAIAYAYVLRKHAHRLGYSPEFRQQVSKAAIDAAEQQIGLLRDRVASRALTDRGEIRRQAKLMLAEAGCSRVLRVDVRPDGSGGSMVVTRRSEPLGRTARWMHAHIYYGSGAAVVTLLHGGGQFETPMGILLNGLTALVVVTGIVGLGFWLWGPRWLTKQEADLSTEEAYSLDRHYSRRIQAVLAADGSSDEEQAQPTNSAFRAASEGDLQRVLEMAKTASDERARDLATLVGQQRRVRSELRRLQRAKFTMNAWRIVHVPASVVLLAVIVAHVLSIWFY